MEGHNVRDLTHWLCHVKDFPEVLVRVNWHEGRQCGVSTIEPADRRGGHSIMSVSELIPKIKKAALRPDAGPDLSKTSTDLLKEKLDALRSMRAEAVGKPKRRAKGTRKKAVSKGGLLGVLGKMTPEGMEALEVALVEGKSEEEIMKIIKANVAG